MNLFKINRRTSIAGALLAVVVASLAPAYASAATRPITIEVTLGASCVYGAASDGTTVNLLWKSASGKRKAYVATPAEVSNGRWAYCSSDGDKVAIGDRIRANDGIAGHLLVVPELTLVSDRVNDRFKGRAPAGDYVRLICGYTIFREPCIASWKIKVNSQGMWGYKPGFDVMGWQPMSLLWKSDAGDQVSMTARGPYVDVTIGSPIVRGATRANGIATVVLRRAGSFDVAGTAVTRAGPDGLFQTKFRDLNGSVVKVRVGDMLTSDVAPDVDLIVPDVQGDMDAATGLLTVICPAESMFARQQGPFDGEFWGPIVFDPYRVDMSSLNVQPGESVRLSCFLVGSGDWVGRSIVAH